MNYEHLSKIFYQQESQHAVIYTARFNSLTARHFDFAIREHNRQHEYQAFLNYTEDLFLLLERVYKKYGQFAQVVNAAKPVVLHQFTLECIVDEVKSTNDIEGVRNTRREIQEILNSTNKSARLESVVKKYNSLNCRRQRRFQNRRRYFSRDFFHAPVFVSEIYRFGAFGVVILSQRPRVAVGGIAAPARYTSILSTRI